MGVGRGVRVVQVLQRERVKRYSRARTVLMRILCILYDEKSPDDEYGQMFRLALSHGVTDQVISMVAHGKARSTSCSTGANSLLLNTMPSMIRP